MLDLTQLTDQEVVVLDQAMGLLVDVTDISTSDTLSLNTMGTLRNALLLEGARRWRIANRPGTRTAIEVYQDQVDAGISKPLSVADHQRGADLRRDINEAAR